MKTRTPQTIYLKDYRPPQFLIDTVDLNIDLAEEWTTVKAELSLRRNPDSTESSNTLMLDGQKMELMAVSLDNVELTQEQYQVDESQLNFSISKVDYSTYYVTKNSTQSGGRIA